MVLMVSAEVTMDKFIEVIKKEAAGFAVKPLNPANVFDEVKMRLNGREKG